MNYILASLAVIIILVKARGEGTMKTVIAFGWILHPQLVGLKEMGRLELNTIWFSSLTYTLGSLIIYKKTIKSSS